MLYRLDYTNGCERLWTRAWTEMAPGSELRPELLTFAMVSPKSCGAWHPHHHLGYELIIPMRGMRYACTVNHTPVELKSGEALLLGPDDVHTDILNPGQSFFAFNFQLRMLSGTPTVIRVFQNNLPVESRKAAFDGERLYRLIDDLNHEIEQSRKTVYYSVNNIFAVLFWELIAAIPNDALEPGLLRQCREDKLLADILRIFEENLTRNLNNSEIAAMLNISLSQLTHHCARILGCSPAKAFLKYRIQSAEQFLRSNPALSVKEAAERFGFANEFYFSRAFKRITGKNPSAY